MIPEFEGSTGICRLGNMRLRGRNFDRLDLIFGPLGLANGRKLQKERFEGEWFPNVVEQNSQRRFAGFFQYDRDKVPKGIIVLRLDGWGSK